jgi:uncharacterized caspase-like protein
VLQLAFILLCLVLPSHANAEKRYALLIGNQAYNDKVGPLKNPHNDVAMVAAALERVGFKTTVIKDADYRSIEAAIRRHVATVRREGQGTISFIYYSGHGAADPDTKVNYLIPTDVTSADDDELWNYSINLNGIVEGLRAQAPGATHYVVFDACRNELNLTHKGQKGLVDKGFLPIPYTPGVMVAYSTAPGRTASDTGHEGGTYARALAEEIVKPGVDSMLVFTRVARRVLREIGQDPFLSASTMPEIYFAGELTFDRPAMSASFANSEPSGRRVALVVGNAAYRHAPHLTNATRDADAVAQLFRTAGFEAVKASNDLSNSDFKRALGDFRGVSQASDIAVVYYSGHGIQFGEQNYLIPVDATPLRESDARDEAVSLESVIEAIKPARRLRLVLLDACRDNPFLAKMERVRITAQRSPSTGGLARPEPSQSETLIAYAAKNGSTCADGDRDHSPFTMALIKHIAEPGLDIRLAFGRVRDEVLKTTSNRQEPFVYGSLGGAVVSLAPALAVPKPAALANLKGDYELVERINTKRAWEVFVETHKTGYYVELAKERMKELDARQREEEDRRAKAAEETKKAQELARAAAEEQRKAAEEARIHAEAEKLAEAKRAEELAKAAADEEARKAAEEVRKQAEAKKLAETKRAEEAAVRAEQARKAAEDAKKAEELAKIAAAEQARKVAEEARRQAEAKKLAETKRAEEAAAKAEQARKAAEDAKRAEELAKAAAAEQARKVAEEARRQAEAKKLAEAKKAEELIKAEEARKAAEAACRREEERLNSLQADANQVGAREELSRLQGELTCDRLRPVIVAMLTELNSSRRPEANTPRQVREAQAELRRIGCLSGHDDGMLDQATKDAIKVYFAKRERPLIKIEITDDFITELTQQPRLCPLDCPPGKTAKDDTCVGTIKSEKSKQVERRRPAREPAARQSAAGTSRLQSASPIRGGGSARPMTGVGF